MRLCRKRDMVLEVDQNPASSFYDVLDTDERRWAGQKGADSQ